MGIGVRQLVTHYSWIGHVMRARQVRGRGVGLVPSPAQVSIVVEVGRVYPEVTRRYQFRTMRLIARMGPAVNRM